MSATMVEEVRPKESRTGLSRILLADDHALMRCGLRQIVEKELDAVEVSEVENGYEALEKVRRHPFDLVVLDVDLPDKSGLEVLKEIRLINPDLPVLMLTMFAEERYGVRALKAGASGYLNKECQPEEVIAALKKVFSGGQFVTPALAEELAKNLRPPSAQFPHKVLSDRELEVLCLIAKGSTLSDISVQLSLSPKTVSTYNSRIKEKLQLSTTASLIRYALDHHLVM